MGGVKLLVEKRGGLVLRARSIVRPNKDIKIYADSELLYLRNRTRQTSQISEKILSQKYNHFRRHTLRMNCWCGRPTRQQDITRYRYLKRNPCSPTHPFASSLNAAIGVGNQKPS